MEFGAQGASWLVGSLNFITSAALLEQQSLATGFHGTLFLSELIFVGEIADNRFLTCQLGGQC